MVRRKKEEVCGKPNQYNLQTLEYDWKELPDTHYELPPQKPMVRDYSGLYGRYAHSKINHTNPINHLPLLQLPTPSRRTVLPLVQQTTPQRSNKLGGSESPYASYDSSNGKRVDSQVGTPLPNLTVNMNYPRHGGSRGEDGAAYLMQWSHEDIKRLIEMNSIEANRQYLR